MLMQVLRLLLLLWGLHVRLRWLRLLGLVVLLLWLWLLLWLQWPWRLHWRLRWRLR